MTERPALAAKHFREGYNCAQAVTTAYADLIGLDEQTLLRASSSFGGGMGRLREVCGAVSGMLLAAGFLYGYDDVKDPTCKREHYRLVQALANAFKDRFGSIVCRDILGKQAGADSPEPTPRTEEFYATRPCERCIRAAVEILDAYIEAHPLPGDSAGNQ